MSDVGNVLFFYFYLLCHIYPGVPHQYAALFSLGLLHYIHDKTNINQHTFNYNTVTTWYMYMLTKYMFLICCAAKRIHADDNFSLIVNARL